MSLPADLLQRAEAHPCFSGCYGGGNDLLCAVDAARPLEPAVDVQCQDCLLFRLGSLSSQLPAGTKPQQLADELTRHVRARRGYALSFAGYHRQGGGFWLSAAYWPTGVFVIKADRGSRPPHTTDVDVLVKAFALGVVRPPHPAMTDPNQYVGHTVFLRAVPPPSVTSLAALLGSSHVSARRSIGFVEVSLAEFLPVSRAFQATASPSQSGSPGVARKPKRAARLGSRCDVCGELVVERPLLTSVYVGCRCG